MLPTFFAATLFALLQGPTPPAAPTEVRWPTYQTFVELTIRFAKGQLTAEVLERGDLGHPEKLPPYIGRYEIRALRGAKRAADVPVVQFDLPLGAPAPAESRAEARRLADRAAASGDAPAAARSRPCTRRASTRRSDTIAPSSTVPSSRRTLPA